MGRVLALGAGLLLAVAAASSANAAGGCGIGWHRGPYGGCRPNGEPVAPEARVVEVPGGGIIYAPLGRACPVGYHLGPHGRRCWPN